MIRHIKNKPIEPDEIFIDSHNLPDFDTNQFEGRLEKAISRRSIIFLGVFFLIVSIIYTSKIWALQINKGEIYAQRGENNRLRNTVVFSERGIIYDRNKVELAWNERGEDKSFSSRRYIENSGVAHLVGYAKYPSKDNYGFYYREDFEGIDGVEKAYDEKLKGENGVRIVEINALGKIQSQNIMTPPKDGENTILAVDSKLNSKIYEIMKNFSETYGFVGGASTIMDVNTGELLAMVSYPEYSSQVLAEGDDSEKIKEYINNKNKPFLNRIIHGAYTPGSIIKPVMAIGVLNEKIIDPNKKILSTGSISLPNPYDSTKFSIFKDWKALGWVDLREAIAFSSDVYFYTVGGGFEDQKGIGISNIDKYSELFGFGEKTNINLQGEINRPIPTPEWKAFNFSGDPWRVGDTYNTVIGQYGYQLTPIQAVRAISAIANYGKLLTPKLLLGENQLSGDIRDVKIPKEYFDIVHEGMRMAVTIGTGQGLNIQAVDIATKTGTAQVGLSNAYVNSWAVGFFPYENPHYAFVIMMERGPAYNDVGATSVARQMFDWMVENTPEYLK
ncbi:MAG: penicillin-binding transpeptidase domain-containing protein [Patescibacteria group bacterium]|nr:penicillin-binding transpeptidase domain-containing protein [Patescibacteria group bacterium]